MAKDTPANPETDTNSDEWEDIRVGIGEEWEIEEAPLIGHFLGSSVQQLKDKSTGEDRATLVHQFSPESDPDAVVFLWGAANLDKAMEQVEPGQRVRVTYLGRDQFRADDGTPRQVKRFRVQVARS